MGNGEGDYCPESDASGWDAQDACLETSTARARLHAHIRSSDKGVTATVVLCVVTAQLNKSYGNRREKSGAKWRRWTLGLDGHCYVLSRCPLHSKLPLPRIS